MERSPDVYTAIPGDLYLSFDDLRQSVAAAHRQRMCAECPFREARFRRQLPYLACILLKAGTCPSREYRWNCRKTGICTPDAPSGSTDLDARRRDRVFTGLRARDRSPELLQSIAWPVNEGIVHCSEGWSGGFRHDDETARIRRSTDRQTRSPDRSGHHVRVRHLFSGEENGARNVMIQARRNAAHKTPILHRPDQGERRT